MSEPTHRLLQVLPSPPLSSPYPSESPQMALQDPSPTQPPSSLGPYASAKHRVTRGRYITSNDKRGYIPVYEYPLNGQWIMMDIDDGYILWTGIWKALGNAKADIVKMLESQPDLAPQLRRVRGGYLKIQGTWMPYEVAKRLARRVAWRIREDLIPLFGPDFPSTCLSPDQPGYGQILGVQQGKRRGRRAALPLPMPAALPPPQSSDFGASLGHSRHQTREEHSANASSLYPVSAIAVEEHDTSQIRSFSHAQGLPGNMLSGYLDQVRTSRERSHVPQSYAPNPDPSLTPSLNDGHGHRSPSAMGPPLLPAVVSRTQESGASNTMPRSSGPVRHAHRPPARHGENARFSPYPGHRRQSSVSSTSSTRATPIDLPPLTIPPPRTRGPGFSGRITETATGMVSTSASISASNSATTSASLPTSLNEYIVLPPIQPLSVATPYELSQARSVGSILPAYSLPPISALDEPPLSASADGFPLRLDSAAVLRRLALDDEELGLTRPVAFSVLDNKRHYRDEGNVRHVITQPTTEQLWRRRRSLSAPPSHPQGDTCMRAQNQRLENRAKSSESYRSPSDASIQRPYYSSGPCRPHLTTRSKMHPYSDQFVEGAYSEEARHDHHLKPSDGLGHNVSVESRSQAVSSSTARDREAIGSPMSIRSNVPHLRDKEHHSDYMRPLASAGSIQPEHSQTRPHLQSSRHMLLSDTDDGTPCSMRKRMPCEMRKFRPRSRSPSRSRSPRPRVNSYCAAHSPNYVSPDANASTSVHQNGSLEDVRRLRSYRFGGVDYLSPSTRPHFDPQAHGPPEGNEPMAVGRGSEKMQACFPRRPMDE